MNAQTNPPQTSTDCNQVPFSKFKHLHRVTDKDKLWFQCPISWDSDDSIWNTSPTKQRTSLTWCHKEYEDAILWLIWLWLEKYWGISILPVAYIVFIKRMHTCLDGIFRNKYQCFFGSWPEDDLLQEFGLHLVLMQTLLGLLLRWSSI